MSGKLEGKVAVGDVVYPVGSDRAGEIIIENGQRIHRLAQHREALDQQSRADQKHHCKRKLQHHDRVAHPRATGARSRPRTLFQRFCGGLPCDL